MGTISIDTAQVLTVADTIKKHNDNISEQMDEITKSISSMNADWDSPSASTAETAYTNMFNAYYNVRYGKIDNNVKYLKENVSDGYNATEEGNKKLSDLFK